MRDSDTSAGSGLTPARLPDIIIPRAGEGREEYDKKAAEAKLCGMRNCRARDAHRVPTDPACIVAFCMAQRRNQFAPRGSTGQREEIRMQTDLRVCKDCRDDKVFMVPTYKEIEEMFIEKVRKQTGGRLPKKIFFGCIDPLELAPLPDFGPDVEAEITFAKPAGKGVPRLLGGSGPGVQT